MIKRASELLKINENEFTEFEEKDCNNNVLKGMICRRATHLYGALILFQINDEPTEQIIYCTPKLHYPLDKNGNFNWPKIQHIEIFDKIDGTNILAYNYRHNDKNFVSFKTRLVPVLKDSRYGSFQAMWDEYRNKNAWVDEVITLNPNMNLSFEMYGSRNPITVKYSISLEVSLLFGVDRNNARVYSPTEIIKTEDTKIPKSFLFDSTMSYTDIYNKFREDMSSEIKKNNDELILEGIIIYAKCENESGYRQLKCKPEDIENIHWASGSIQRNAIWTTAINAFENWDNPTLENVITLLKEEFSDDSIGRSQIRIQKTFEEAIEHMKMVKEVNNVWKLASEKGLDITKDKVATMRFISQYFDRNKMSVVGGIILSQAGLLKERKK